MLEVDNSTEMPSEFRFTASAMDENETIWTVTEVLPMQTEMPSFEEIAGIFMLDASCAGFWVYAPLYAYATSGSVGY